MKETLQREAALAAYRQFWEPHTFTDVQVRPLWEGLRERGVLVGILSNTIWSGEYHRGVFERDGVLDLIDADVYSSEIAWTNRIQRPSVPRLPRSAWSRLRPYMSGTGPSGRPREPGGRDARHLDPAFEDPCGTAGLGR